MMKTRLGIHEGVQENCSENDLLFLDLVGEDEKLTELEQHPHSHRFSKVGGNMISLMILICSTALLSGSDPHEYEFLDVDYDSIFASAQEAYMQEDYERAIADYLAFLERNASNASALYNLACCYGLIGDEQLAADFMLRSFRAGFSDVGWIMYDPDFDSVRNGEIFTPALDSIIAAEEERQLSLGSITYTPGISMIPCRIMLPDDFDPYSTYDLLIGLHGYGSSPDIFAGLWDRFENPDFIYAVPQAPYPRFSGSEPGYSWILWSDDEQLASSTVDLSHLYVTDLTRFLQQEFFVSNTYLFGFSQGSGMTFEVGLLNPDLYDGLICFAGWLDTAIVTESNVLAASDMRIFIGHGTEDAVVEYEAGIAAFDYLQSLGIDVELHDFPSGHTVDEETLRRAQDWMSE